VTTRTTESFLVADFLNSVRRKHASPEVAAYKLKFAATLWTIHFCGPILIKIRVANSSAASRLPPSWSFIHSRWRSISRPVISATARAFTLTALGVQTTSVACIVRCHAAMCRHRVCYWMFVWFPCYWHCVDFLQRPAS